MRDEAEWTWGKRDSGLAGKGFEGTGDLRFYF